MCHLRHSGKGIGDMSVSAAASDPVSEQNDGDAEDAEVAAPSSRRILACRFSSGQVQYPYRDFLIVGAYIFRCRSLRFAYGCCCLFHHTKQKG